jgi:glyoxylase-like metal-dependent hydrolase (beta-lactamase superfamily II)
MSVVEATSKTLSWKVLTSKRPGLSRDLPPGKEALSWVANSSTLISGERDAVLVDTFLTTAQSQTLLDWVIASGKNLTSIYITHGHGDHFFGLAQLLKHFPRAKALAVPAVAHTMQAQLTPEKIDYWRKLFPGEIPDRLMAAEPLTGDRFELEGRALIAIDMGRTDTAVSTCLHVPSIGLIAAGDTVYSGIHPFLAETDTQSRQEWIAALDRLEALNPRAVVAGHKKPENDDDPRDIAETRQYLVDFNRLDEVTKTARELYDAMLALYPDRINPGSLWRGANAAKNK